MVEHHKLVVDLNMMTFDLRLVTSDIIIVATVVAMESVFIVPNTFSTSE